jgi:CRP-like cAMP-binding protein
VLKTEIARMSDFLASHGWLRFTPRDFADNLLAHCHWRQFAPGAGIQHAGDAGGIIAGIADGSATLTTSLSSPDSPILHVMHPGSWFGFVPLFIGGSRPNSIVARTNVTIATMSQAEVEAFMVGRPEGWRHLGTLGIVHANTATSIAADMMIRDSPRRCAAALLQLADCRHADRPASSDAHTPMSQDELAAVANLSRTSVSSILRKFEAAGLIKLGYRDVTLVNPAALRALVDNV